MKNEIWVFQRSVLHGRNGDINSLAIRWKGKSPFSREDFLSVPLERKSNYASETTAAAEINKRRKMGKEIHCSRR